MGEEGYHNDNEHRLSPGRYADEEHEEDDEEWTDGDDSGEVGPEILDELSDYEERRPKRRPKRRRRAKAKAKQTAKECSGCRDLKHRWHAEVSSLIARGNRERLDFQARIRELRNENERLKRDRTLRLPVSLEDFRW